MLKSIEMGFAVSLAICTVIFIMFDQCFALLQFDEQKNHTTTINNDISEDVYIYEGFCQMTCNKSNVNNDYRLNSCCIKCDCSSLCVGAGTCCIDAPLEHTEAENLQIADDYKERCVQTAIGHIHAKPGIKYVNSYMLIQFCEFEAVKKISDDVIHKCLQPNEDNIEEVLPVYSNETGKNYRNIFCAMCNEDDLSALPWESQFMCDIFLKALYIFPKIVESSVLVNIKNQEGCQLQFKPINDKARECVDPKKIISDCSRSETPHASTQLSNLCSKVYSPVKGTLGIYKNVHCLQCNEDFLNFNSYCRNNAPANIVFTITNLRIEVYSSFYHSNHKPLRESFMCMAGKIYDKWLKRCISKRCGLNEVQIKNKCVPFFQTFVGVSLDYRFTLLYQSEKILFSSEEKLFAEVRHLVLHEASSVICAEKLLSIDVDKRQVSQKIQLTKVSATDKFNIEGDLELVKEKIKKLNKLAVKGNKTFTIEIDNSPVIPILDTYVNLATFKEQSYSESCGFSVAVSSMQFCKRVEVTNFYINKNMDAIVDENIFFAQNEYIESFERGNRSIDICYDLFVSRVMNVSYFGKSGMSRIIDKQNISYSLLSMIVYLQAVF